MLKAQALGLIPPPSNLGTGIQPPQEDEPGSGLPGLPKHLPQINYSTEKLDLSSFILYEYENVKEEYKH